MNLKHLQSNIIQAILPVLHPDSPNLRHLQWHSWQAELVYRFLDFDVTRRTRKGNFLNQIDP